MTHTIVVGVDGSYASAEALTWASGQARLTGSELRVIYAWEPPNVCSLRLPYDVVRAMLGDAHDVHIVTSTESGPAGQVLVEASTDADLLVIGTRGLGLVGQYCAARAHCPVVIVHGTPVATGASVLSRSA